jgi:sugar lactone lactonase YvrE
VSAGTSDAVCAATLDLTATTLAPGCAEFILGELTQWFSPPAATAEELVELSVEPSDNPLDYAVAYCDLASSSAAPSSGIAVAPVAGNGYQGFINGPALSSELNSPTGIAIDRNGDVYFDDYGNNVIRELSSAPSQQVTTFAGTGVAGYTGDDGPASAATFNHPAQLAFDAEYNLYVADTENNVVREITRAGIITTIAGTGAPGFNGDNQAATQAMLSFPDSLAFDLAGNLYIADAENNRIRMVSGNGVISTVAGTGTAGYNSDNILATNAWLNFPSRIVLDPSGNMYIADCHNNRVRLVNRSTGIITTIAGNGTAGYQGNGSAAANAELNNPLSIALDASGDVYIADLDNQVIRVVNMQSSPATLSGVTVQPGTIATVVGGGPQSDTTPGPALSVALGFPTGLLVDPAGNLYFADADYNLILKVTNAN